MTAPPQTRVVIADDHPVYRAGLRAVVEDSDVLELVGEASAGDQVIAVVLDQRPDVVLMDIHMPVTSGIDATRQILADHPSCAVVMLSMLEDDASVFAAMRTGARGYLLKGATPDDIIRAVTAAANGEAIFSPALADRMVHFFTVGRSGDPHPFPHLSPRERDILELIAAGQANTEIAERLALREKTVRNNVSTILTKLQTVDRSAAIVRAREAGLGARPESRAPHDWKPG